MEKDRTNTMKVVINTNNNEPTTVFNWKNTIIIILIVLLIASTLGINLLVFINNGITMLGELFITIGHYITQFLNYLAVYFGYASGTVINTTADISTGLVKNVADVSTGVVKNAADISSGVLHSVGDTLLKVGQEQKAAAEPPTNLDSSINKSGSTGSPPIQPNPDTTASSIQNPIGSGKQKWCLAGEYEGKRGCVLVEDSHKCVSGQIFPTQQTCMK